MIFGRLEQFVEARFGADVWGALLGDAGIGSKIYLASSAYPDAGIAAIVAAASARTGTAPAELLEAFGEFLVPAYLQMYGHRDEQPREGLRPGGHGDRGGGAPADCRRGEPAQRRLPRHEAGADEPLAPARAVPRRAGDYAFWKVKAPSFTSTFTTAPVV